MSAVCNQLTCDNGKVRAGLHVEFLSLENGLELGCWQMQLFSKIDLCEDKNSAVAFRVSTPHNVGNTAALGIPRSVLSAGHGL